MIRKFLKRLLAIVVMSVATLLSGKAQSSPPYSITWVNSIGSSINGSILTRTATSGTWSASGAVSSNLLSSGTDGWMEFEAVYGTDYIVGLAENNAINHTEFTHGIQLIRNSNIAYAHEEAANGVSLGTFQTGDVFRISREGSAVKYYKNGVVLRTVGVSVSQELKVKAALLQNGYSTPAITTSFDCRLIVYGTVTSTDGGNGTGSVSVSVTGGSSPYTYSWSSGEQTSSIENKPHGSYAVAVTDALGRTMTRTYSVGYKINWINQIGVSQTDGRLTKTAQDTQWTSGAISSNILPANTDGWIEFVGVNGHHFTMGLATNNIIDYNQSISMIQLDYYTGRAIASEGNTSNSLGNFQTGDVFRISREGGSLKYYRNDVLLRTITVASSLELKVKATLAITGSSTPKITSSFDSQLVVSGTVSGTDGAGGLGSISVSVTGGSSPYTYSWSSGEQTSSIENKPHGSYAVTVTDALGRTMAHTYSVGYKINWINQIGVSQTDGRLTKTAQGTQWTSGAISSNILPANTDGWIEFVGVNGHHFTMGLATNNIIDYNQYTSMIQLDYYTGRAIASEGNTSNSLGNFQTGDVFRISREGSSLKYYRNDVLLRTIAVASSLELKVKATLAITGSSTPKITSSFDSQLVVSGTVTSTDTSNGTGGVSVSVTGGSSPYTYSWSSGEQTSSIENKPHGSYAVAVTDALGRTMTRTYSVGYKINWINQIGVSQTDGRLTKTAQGTQWTSGAISSNILPANTDGWIEFVGVNGHHFTMGLATNNIIDYNQYTSMIQLDYYTGRAIAFEGNTSNSLGNFQTGDVFRISREGSSLKYYRNDVLLRTIAVASSLELKVKATLAITGSSTPKITSSFDSRLVVYSNVIGLEGNSGSGSITLNVIGGNAPYTYSWSSGEQTSAIVNKPRGAYTVTVNDALGRTITRTYNIGYKANWINLAGVTVNDGRLTKTAQDAQWTSGAISSNILPANTDGWVEFVGINGHHFMLGLTTNNVISNTQFTSMLHLDYYNGRALSFEGSTSNSLGNFQTGDVFKILREGGTVKYLKNGIVLRTISVSSSATLKIKACLLITNSGTPYVNSSFWSSDGVARTYYAIADGTWTTPSIWSLTENGPPSTVYPDDIDKVVIKGHEVTVTSDVKSTGVTITSTNDNTRLKVDGNTAVLTVKGNILMNRGEGVNTAELLKVENNGRLEVK